MTDDTRALVAAQLTKAWATIHHQSTYRLNSLAKIYALVYEALDADPSLATLPEGWEERASNWRN